MYRLRLWLLGLMALVSIQGNTLIAEVTGVTFLPNAGQWPSEVLYKANIPGGQLFLSKSGLTYNLVDEGTLHHWAHDGIASKTGTIAAHALKVNFVNPSSGAHLLPATDLSTTRYNYFIGNDPSHWATGLQATRRIVLADVWPGIDFELLSQEGGEGVKYNFIVHPGANASLIKMAINGANSIALQDGTIRMSTSLATIIDGKPLTWYQEPTQSDNVSTSRSAASSSPPSVSWLLAGNEIGFKLSSYNKNKTLIIDPTVVFATFSGSVADNFGFTATYDQSGNGYSGGTVYDFGFPTTPGAYQITYAGGATQDDELARDEGILKYSPDGKKLLWATYIGGKGNEQPHSMIVNSNGDLLIMGTTSSTNYPITQGAADPTYNGNTDIFVTKLSSNGQRIIHSTFLGGSAKDGLNGRVHMNAFSSPLAYNYGDEYRGEIIVDNLDNVYITSTTQSSDFSSFGNNGGAYAGGDQDALVLSLSPNLGTVRWGRYLGGSSSDAGYGIAIDPAGNIFAGGGTQSADLPTLNVLNRNYFGATDGYLAKFTKNGVLQNLAYIGTPSYDQVHFVQVDLEGNVYVTGQSEGSFPHSPGVYGTPGGRQFIQVYSNDLNSLLQSTTFGSGRAKVDMSPSAFLVDLCGRVYVSGWGGSTNNLYNRKTGSTLGMPVTSDAYQRGTDGSDFYLIILSKGLGNLIYGSYFGGDVSAEHVDGGTSRFDRDGHVYQSVCGGCGGYSDFPTTPGAWSQINKGRRPGDPNVGGCNNALFKIDLNSSLFAPRMKDTTLVLTATSVLNYNFSITDLDGQDSIYVSYASPLLDPGKVNPPLPLVNVPRSGMGTIKGSIYWQTSCDHSRLDTQVIAFYIRDNGCPTPRQDTAYIRIVILPPVPPPPPAVFCLERINANTLGLSWGDFSIDRYFGSFKLVRKDPDGSIKVLKTITSTNESRAVDPTAFNHLTTGYEYFMYGVNVCGDIGDTTRIVNSIPDEDSLPVAPYLYTVTVENDQDIRVTWFHYAKNDFYYYLVYRKENRTGSDWILYSSTRNVNDTTLLDSNVNVHERSYCYRLVVRTQCGLESKPSNDGCSIFLSGLSVPFEHKLSWNEYREWKGGVEGYQVHRWDATPRIDSIIGFSSANNKTYTDSMLDYDMGLYWYRVEGIEGKTGMGATSLSNTVRLVQAPIVYPPNVFSPNADTKNDYYKPYPVFVKGYLLKVYNRWGERVYTTDNRKSLGWDGYFKGQDPVEGVYIWQVDYTGWDNSSHADEGNVTLIR